MLMKKEREFIAAYGKKMYISGLSKGTSGNISYYDKDKGIMAISPSGINYTEIIAEDIVLMDNNANIIDGKRIPSSEYRMHLAIYENNDIAKAIVHAHSTFCTTFACLQEPLEAVHYGIASARTNRIPVVPYEIFGSIDLANAVKKNLKDYKGLAMLLANHGIISWGTDLEQAYGVCENMEFLAELMWRARCIGKPQILQKNEVDEVIDKFRNYGQEDKNKTSY